MLVSVGSTKLNVGMDHTTAYIDYIHYVPITKMYPESIVKM